MTQFLLAYYHAICTSSNLVMNKVITYPHKNIFTDMIDTNVRINMSKFKYINKSIVSCIFNNKLPLQSDLSLLKAKHISL